MTTWTRTAGAAQLFAKGNGLLATIAAGKTMLHAFAGFQARLRTGTEEDPFQATNFTVGIGIYSQLVTGGTTLYPLDNPGDFAPPTQRWLHWRVAYFAPANPGAAKFGGYQTYYTSFDPVDIEIEAQVKATPGALNIQFAFQPQGTIKGSWFPQIAWWASVLSS